MSRWRVLIGSRSFGKADAGHLRLLEAAGCEVTPNTIGRAYRADELLEVLPGHDAIVTGTDALTREVIARAAPGLKTIAKHGAGIETIDLAAAAEHGVVVSATPGAMDDSVADLTLGLVLALVRGIPRAHAGVVAGGWPVLQGTELRGKTLGLVGLGRIGRAVALRAAAFGMELAAHDPLADRAFAAEHGIALLAFDELLGAADVVSLHAAAGDGPPLLGERELRLMRPGALLVNTSRGRLIDEDAVAAALGQGHLGGAGLDVFRSEPPAADSPLLRLDNVVLTPHVGGLTREALLRMGEMTVDNCLTALRGGRPAGLVEAS